MDRVGVVASLRAVVCFIISTIMLPLTNVYADYQGNALIALKNGLVDPTSALSTWNNSTNVTNPCGWKHIFCDPNNKEVEVVDLRELQLEGPLVSQLGDLDKLQSLLLFNNKFFGSIPKELGKLSKVVVLALYGNSLTGNVPEELGDETKMPNLKLLLLNDNKLSGRLPAAIENLDEYKVNFTGNKDLCGKYTANVTCSSST